MTEPATDNRGRMRVAQWRERVCRIGCCLMLLVSGCDFPGKPNEADRPVLPKDVVQFSPLFQQNCGGCHGADGTSGAAPPLHDALFRALVSSDELEQTIAQGRPGTPMPAFAQDSGGTLTPTQIQVLVEEIKGFRYKLVETAAASGQLAVVEDPGGAMPQWGLPAAPPENAPAYAAAAVGPELSRDAYERIRQTTFVRACAGCHGPYGEGGIGPARSMARPFSTSPAIKLCGGSSSPDAPT